MAVSLLLTLQTAQLTFIRHLPCGPGSQNGTYVQTGIPTSTANAKFANLTQAAEAGVKGVVYVWEHITTGNAFGQYVPFKRLYQEVPTVLWLVMPSMLLSKRA